MERVISNKRAWEVYPLSWPAQQGRYSSKPNLALVISHRLRAASVHSGKFPTDIVLRIGEV
jgi:hypothetical protein